jgi:ComF family protein
MMRDLPVLSDMVDLFFPQICPGCGSEADRGRELCEDCHSRIGNRLSPFEPPELIRSAWTLGPYDGPLGALIRRGKYAPSGHVLGTLGCWLSEAARGRLPPVDLVSHVPVPMSRRARRGFDQADLLAAPVARALNRPHRALLHRTASSEQAGRNRRARLQWARQAFRAREIGGSRVLLVDDVCTTGATSSGCAAALLEAGAQSVDLLCVARTAGISR